MNLLRCGMLALLLVAGCAGHQTAQTVEVRNPYIDKAERLSRAGVAALARQQPARARGMFEQALSSATLANDAYRMALGWYNLGRAQEAGGDRIAAGEAYSKAVEIAEAGGDRVNRLRAQLALQLLKKDGRRIAISVADGDPVDVQLAAARLADRRGQQQVARHAYQRVLNLAGVDRAGLLYAARAHLGLARIAHNGGDAATAESGVNSALQLLHRAGEPRLMQRALYLAADIEEDMIRQQHLRQRAGEISRFLREQGGS